VDDALTVTIESLLPERLQRLRRLAGLPVAFGGVVRASPAGQSLVLTRLAGTKGTGLRDLAVSPGLGLGGQVLSTATPRRVDRYATTTTITHDYDRIVVQEEQLTSVVAVPVTARGTVREAVRHLGQRRGIVVVVDDARRRSIHTVRGRGHTIGPTGDGR